MNSHLERIPQNGLAAAATRRRGYRAAADAMGCVWSIAGFTVVKRSTFTATKHHGPRPEEAPYG